MTSAQEKTVNPTDLEQSTMVVPNADSIFEFLADVRNVPQYLPTVKNAEPC
jgi:ribosome-associated toxin RatA of RatAB toxin-antitoxin module